jgi:hypothetical protein
MTLLPPYFWPLVGGAAVVLVAAMVCVWRRRRATSFRRSCTPRLDENGRAEEAARLRNDYSV